MKRQFQIEDQRRGVTDLKCSVKSISTIAAIVSMLVFSGCSGTRSDALLGAWQTGVIPCEWGSNQITVQFLADGRVVGTNDFVSGGPLSWEGTYRVRGNVIQRTIKGDMQEIAYWIEGDRLRMQIDHEDYRFIRLTTEPGGAANRSQSAGPETNRTSSAAGSGG